MRLIYAAVLLLMSCIPSLAQVAEATKYCLRVYSELAPDNLSVVNWEKKRLIDLSILCKEDIRSRDAARDRGISVEYEEFAFGYSGNDQERELFESRSCQQDFTDVDTEGYFELVQSTHNPILKDKANECLRIAMSSGGPLRCEIAATADPMILQLHVAYIEDRDVPRPTVTSAIVVNGNVMTGPPASLIEAAARKYGIDPASITGDLSVTDPTIAAATFDVLTAMGSRNSELLATFGSSEATDVIADIHGKVLGPGYRSYSIRRSNIYDLVGVNIQTDQGLSCDPKSEPFIPLKVTYRMQPVGSTVEVANQIQRKEDGVGCDDTVQRAVKMCMTLPNTRINSFIPPAGGGRCGSTILAHEQSGDSCVNVDYLLRGCGTRWGNCRGTGYLNFSVEFLGTTTTGRYVGTEYSVTKSYPQLRSDTITNRLPAELPGVEVSDWKYVIEIEHMVPAGSTLVPESITLSNEEAEDGLFSSRLAFDEESGFVSLILKRYTQQEMDQREAEEREAELSELLVNELTLQQMINQNPLINPAELIVEAIGRIREDFTAVGGDLVYSEETQ